MNISAQMAFQDKRWNLRPIWDAALFSQKLWRTIGSPETPSRWRQELEKRFQELVSLPGGWDGYDGKPVSLGCAQFAAKLLDTLYADNIPAPHLVPGADGTLQMEWHCNHFDLEIDILAPNNVVASRSDHVTGQEDEIGLQTGFTELAGWVKDLGRDRPAPPRTKKR